jgi:hypothetical protein
VVLPVLVLAGLAIGVPIGVYGRWAGWGFGLGWWGRSTPARVIEVTPVSGALMKGGAEWAVTEASHRVRVDLEVQPPGGSAYRASAIAWQPSGESLSGRTVMARVSRTRPGRVHVPKGAPDAPGADGSY